MTALRFRENLAAPGKGVEGAIHYARLHFSVSRYAVAIAVLRCDTVTVNAFRVNMTKVSLAPDLNLDLT